MKTLFYGQLDLTKLGDIARKNPELVKKVQFRDGREHQLLNVSILAKDEPDQYGKVATVRVDCKKEEQKDGLVYFVGDLKPSTQEQKQEQSTQSVPQTSCNPDDLPF